jgi:hypothetical protein
MLPANVNQRRSRSFGSPQGATILSGLCYFSYRFDEGPCAPDRDKDNDDGENAREDDQNRYALAA